jgi:hypothetical protein
VTFHAQNLSTVTLLLPTTVTVALLRPALISKRSCGTGILRPTDRASWASELVREGSKYIAHAPALAWLYLPITRRRADYAEAMRVASLGRLAPRDRPAVAGCWWLFVAAFAGAAPSVLDGLARCQTNSYPLIGVECGSGLSPAIPLGVSILLNLLFAGVLVGVFVTGRSSSGNRQES